MREITPRLTKELAAHCGGAPVWRAPPYAALSFRSLMEHVARLSYANRDELLFYRGQDVDYESKAGGTTLYPAIYRGDALPRRELRHRFDLLDSAAKLLVDKFKRARIEGHYELRTKKYIQWSILQHYEVVATPLLDITHSLRVACSFAQLNNKGGECYVYVMGLPYVTNRITFNSEHDIVNVRLLSICPPSALRPYFQEGFLAGTADITTDFDSKTELDFRNRLVAKFSIPGTTAFWGSGFDRMPENALYPRKDSILDLCNEIKMELKDELTPGDLGVFVKEWADLESRLLETARRTTERNVSVREAISSLAKQRAIAKSLAEELDALRAFRNQIVHRPAQIEGETLHTWHERLRRAIKSLGTLDATQ